MQRIVIGFGVAAFVVIAWLGRYEVIATGTGGRNQAPYAYRLDRWTGSVLFLVREWKIEAKEETPKFDINSAKPVEERKPAVKWEDFTPVK